MSYIVMEKTASLSDLIQKQVKDDTAELLLSKRTSTDDSGSTRSVSFLIYLSKSFLEY